MTLSPPAGSPQDGPAQDDFSWRELESRVGIDDLPAFHRAFLTWRGVQGAQDMPLRRVQQRVEAELNRMAQGGQAERAEGDWRLRAEALSGFATALPFLKSLPFLG